MNNGVSSSSPFCNCMDEEVDCSSVVSTVAEFPSSFFSLILLESASFDLFSWLKGKENLNPEEGGLLVVVFVAGVPKLKAGALDCPNEKPPDVVECSVVSSFFQKSIQN